MAPKIDKSPQLVRAPDNRLGIRIARRCEDPRQHFHQTDFPAIDIAIARKYNLPMKIPFPGMDPYLEHPALWTDVHNSLVVAISNAISSAIAPNYYVGMERRNSLLMPPNIPEVSHPNVIVKGGSAPIIVQSAPDIVGISDVRVADVLGENFVEIHEVKTGRLVTLIEVLSPTNKVTKDGRTQYLEKRAQILSTRTNLVEIDLLRAGEPMPLMRNPAVSDYRILVSDGYLRPKAQLHSFSLRRPIPTFPLPLLPNEDQPLVDLNTILHDLYTRARFDLRLDYAQSPPSPPLSQEDSEWLHGLIT